jgi:cytidylate kinase
MKTKIIAIDGPSASGKGTLAKKLAEALGFSHLDTGATFRYIAKAVLDAGANPADEKTIIKIAQDVAPHITLEKLSDPSLRTDVIGQATSKVSVFPKVRAAILKFQQDFAARQNSVLDGRDVGTVICPDANAKLFVIADTKERARRRHAELSQRGIDVSYETVLADMRERDERDSSRAVAPLKPAPDAVILDTTGLSPEETLQKALSIVRARL